jgi:hypothetical protein
MSHRISSFKAFDDYLDALSNPSYWAGEVELTALSRMFNVSFTVISSSGRDLAIGEPTAPKNIVLAYSHGNHYDLVLSRARVRSLAFGQKTLFGLIQTLHDNGRIQCGNLHRANLAEPAPPVVAGVEQPWSSSTIGARGLRVPNEAHVYQNLGLHSWLNSMRELSESDELVCSAAQQVCRMLTLSTLLSMLKISRLAVTTRM